MKPRAVLVAGLIVMGAPAAPAQTTDCDRLYAAIRTSESADAGSNRWDRAAEQQRREIDRTKRFADRLGCGQGGGLFGSGAPPQCGPLQDRMKRMQDNLANLETRGDQAAPIDDPARASLLARYNAQCVGPDSPSASSLAQRGTHGFWPDDGRDPADMPNPDALSSVPLDGSIMDGTDEPGPVLGQAICVRTCDGGYFPLSPHASQGQLDGLEQLCQASCPNTEAKLFTMGRGGDLTTATAVDGESYTALPAAFAFEKAFSPTCTCKPPNQSWVEALAEAEKLLGEPGRHDVMVTTAMSDQMAKPVAVPAGSGKAAKPQRAAAPPKIAPDLSMARDAQKGAEAPTASNDTTGIGGPVTTERVVRAGDGPTVAVAGPDGIRKRIRLIVP